MEVADASVRRMTHMRRHSRSETTPASRHGPSHPTQVITAVAVCLVLLVLFRGHWLLSNLLLNVDEGELLAAGKRAHLDLLPYSTYTTDTYFFLWPLFLGILGTVGIPLTLPTAHVLGGLTYAYLALTGWYIFYRQHGWKWATAIVAPTAIYLFAGASSTDFLEMGTELLPLAIIVTAALVLFAPGSDITRGRLIAGAGISGLALWAKPQLGPLGASIVVSAVIVHALERRRSAHFTESEESTTQKRETMHDLLVTGAAFLLPSIALLLLIALTGEWHAFTREALPSLFGYIASSNSSSTILAARLQNVGYFLSGAPLAFVWALGGLLGWPRPQRASRSLKMELSAWILPLLTATLTLFALPQLFAHYGNIVYGGAMLSAIAGCRIARLATDNENVLPASRNLLRIIITVSAVAVALVTGGTVWQNLVFWRGYVATVVARHRIPSVDAIPINQSPLPRWCPAGASVADWGWAPEVYSFYNWEPASRYVITTWQIDSSRHVPYYRRVLLAELEERPPTCIIETIGPAFFPGIPTTESLPRVIPASKRFLASCFVERSTLAYGVYPGLGPVTVYVRKPVCSRKQVHLKL